MNEQRQYAHLLNVQALRNNFQWLHHNITTLQQAIKSDKERLLTHKILTLSRKTPEIISDDAHAHYALL